MKRKQSKRPKSPKLNKNNMIKETKYYEYTIKVYFNWHQTFTTYIISTNKNSAINKALNTLPKPLLKDYIMHDVISEIRIFKA